MENNILQLETEIANVLRNIYNPEIPVNIFDLGLIYEINVDETRKVGIVMTMTAPNCPMADELLAEVNEKVKEIPGPECKAMDYNPIAKQYEFFCIVILEI